MAILKTLGILTVIAIVVETKKGNEIRMGTETEGEIETTTTIVAPVIQAGVPAGEDR